MKTWLPHNHRILVEVDVVEERTAGGLILPDQTRTKEQNQQIMATVLAVGPTAQVDPNLITRGARVLIARWGGFEVPGKPNIKIVADEDICAVEVSDD